jgi:hypothetical protein
MWACPQFKDSLAVYKSVHTCLPHVFCDKKTSNHSTKKGVHAPELTRSILARNLARKMATQIRAHLDYDWNLNKTPEDRECEKKTGYENSRKPLENSELEFLNKSRRS